MEKAHFSVVFSRNSGLVEATKLGNFSFTYPLGVLIVVIIHIISSCFLWLLKFLPAVYGVYGSGVSEMLLVFNCTCVYVCSL